ncbi:MAG: YihY/virulence factor BrkB family protein [Calditrichaeota bacterium]|nr:YihY/virulence factor BrkB family protein [Calditrichota bacterium]RQW04703.1 MAG: YihY/virulence factor BrkB family protein [Calditrichota bacterium]
MKKRNLKSVLIEKICLRKIWDSFRYYITGLYKHIDAHNDLLFSGGLSFSLFTCILPLILIVFSLIGILLEQPGVLNYVRDIIDTMIPYGSSAEVIKEVIFSRINEFRIFKTISGSLGIFGLFFAASGLFGAMRTILHTIFGIKETKNILVDKLRDFGMVLVVVSFFLLFMGILPAVDIIINLLSKSDLAFLSIIRGFLSSLISIIVSSISFLLVFFMFSLIYYLIPYGQLPWKVIFVGAFWAAFLWIIAKELFGYYVTHAMLLTRVYGTYLFIVVSALWIYYSSFIFILGAEIASLYQEKKLQEQK